LEENYLLEMLDIEKQFPGVKALDHAKLQLRPGSIHALMGENGAGKSTLMKCLFGIYKKDAGSIRMNGKEINFTNPRNALDHGVAMVHQELNQVLYRSVMENMWLGRFPLKAGLVDHKKMYNDTKAVLDDLEIKVDPKAIIGTMAVSQRQMLEIAKAVSYNAKILVLDEPTSSLTSEEVEHLFRIMRRLCDQGVGIIYISHKMDEIKRISDEVTIMRDGQWISTDKTENLSTDDIIKRMVNREMTNRFPAKDNVPGDVLMAVSHLTGKYMPTCQDVSFELRAGEVLGVAGLVGSRRTELLSTIFGIMARESGEIKLNGKPISNKTPRQSIKNGFAMLTEERRATGIFPYASILFNTVISNLGSYKKGLLLSDKKMTADTDWSISSMHIKTPSQKTLIKNLSGGNQQKVILGRWLLTNPDVLLLDEPTRGIDVGAKYEIYELILQLAKQGKAVMMVSSEMPELIGICDRILVMSNGHMAGILERGKDFGGIKNEQETIMRLAAQYV
jgi:methyl-galactoside transport system ATP-binding protein